MAERLRYVRKKKITTIMKCGHALRHVIVDLKLRR